MDCVLSYVDFELMKVTKFGGRSPKFGVNHVHCPVLMCLDVDYFVFSM